jgi:hypothetical protein
MSRDNMIKAIMVLNNKNKGLKTILGKGITPIGGGVDVTIPSLSKNLTFDF